MMSNKVVLLGLMLVVSTMCTLSMKENVYNVTEDNFEEFVEFAKGKNATFYLKFYSRNLDRLSCSYVPALSAV